MALELTVKTMKWNERSREYETEIMLGESNMVYRYGITVNGSNVYFIPDHSPKNRLGIWDMNDCPFNGNKPHIHLCPYNERSKGMLKEAREAFYHFIATECSEE